jgi:2-polyprenyl-3-methyl-5-hydroxy-6-metoxy-1,4-benzoquinol methylase
MTGALPASGGFRRRARGSAARQTLRFAFHLLRPKRLYEPVEIGGNHYSGKRDADLRWQAIAGMIRHFDARSLLDVGCAEGWFLRKAAREFGCFSIGVDADDRRVAIGEIARLHDGAERVAVMKARLEPADIRALPRCDVVLCLSVVHHIIRDGGLPAAEAFVEALATRAKRGLIFEIGTSDEKELHWSALLPKMPGGQEAFVRQLLEAAGLVNVHVIAGSPGLKGDAQRLLFVAEPPPKLR